MKLGDKNSDGLILVGYGEEDDDGFYWHRKRGGVKDAAGWSSYHEYDVLSFLEEAGCVIEDREVDGQDLKLIWTQDEKALEKKIQEQLAEYAANETKVGEEGEFGVLIAKGDMGLQQKVPWLEELLEEAYEKGLEPGGQDEVDFLEECGLEIQIKEWDLDEFMQNGTIYFCWMPEDEDDTIQSITDKIEEL